MYSVSKELVEQLSVIRHKVADVVNMASDRVWEGCKWENNEFGRDTSFEDFKTMIREDTIKFLDMAEKGEYTEIIALMDRPEKTVEIPAVKALAEAIQKYKDMHSRKENASQNDPETVTKSVSAELGGFKKSFDEGKSPIDQMIDAQWHKHGKDDGFGSYRGGIAFVAREEARRADFPERENGGRG